MPASVNTYLVPVITGRNVFLWATQSIKMFGNVWVTNRVWGMFGARKQTPNVWGSLGAKGGGPDAAAQTGGAVASNRWLSNQLHLG
jgi:hypothetical protein